MIAIARQSPKRTREFDTPSLPQQEEGPFRAPCLHDLFEAQAAAVPNSEALVVGAKRFTYLELNARANRVAHHLRSLGVGRESLVGIFLERSADMVIAILGVLKAGGAYLPLDPGYPRERLAFMLMDAHVSTMLTQSSLLWAVRGFKRASGGALQIICLGTEACIARGSAENPALSTQANDLAYVIYTSGSTGQPKGVAIEHRNAVALIHWAKQVYSAREWDGVLAGSSISFDPSILDLLTPLCLGGKVILARNTLAIGGLAASSEVRTITTVPSVMRELLRIGGIPKSVETINLGGEPLSPQFVRELYALPQIKRVYDLYGPTETTTCSTFALRTPGGPATIGRPITNTQVFVLDEYLRPVPVGATGELFIGGAGVARGYLNRPEITEEKFVHLPFATGRPTRFYRTGDLCRRLPAGELEFIGRLDQQVKIRGFRVELGEIESVLLTHPSVKETIVIAHEESSGERRLVAYVVPRAAPGEQKAEVPSAAEDRIVPQLRAYLQERLPDYMLPSVFILLERFELTPNGKISRAILPDPARRRAGAGDYLAPRTSTENLLCQIWADLLGLKQIGVRDDFIELGGDSLLGVAMLAEVENKTGIRLPVETMLQESSLGRIAAFLDLQRQSRGPAPGPSWVEIQPQGNRAPLFLVHGVGGGMLWGYANLARHLGADQPVYAFKAFDADRLDEFDSIEKMAAHFVKELREFQSEGPYALGGYCFGGNVAFEMARLLDQQGQTVSLLALMNASPPNSSYDRVSWSFAHLCKFMCNLFHWTGGFLRWDFVKQRRFLRWKIWNLQRRIAQRLRLTSPGSTESDVDDRLDMSAVTEDKRCLWESHVQALDKHRTQSFGGKVVLLRTPGHALNCSYDTRCGWGEFAQGGVTVQIVPGLHESLLEEPFVRVLARELRAHLDAVQPKEGMSL